MKGGQFRNTNKKGASKLKIVHSVAIKCPKCGTTQELHPRNCPNHPRNVKVEEGE